MASAYKELRDRFDKWMQENYADKFDDDGQLYGNYDMWRVYKAAHAEAQAEIEALRKDATQPWQARWKTMASTYEELWRKQSFGALVRALTGMRAIPMRNIETYEDGNIQNAWVVFKAILDECQAEIEPLRKDAERYRAIRDRIGVVEWKAITGTMIGMLPNGDKLDTEIDAAMRREVKNNA